MPHDVCRPTALTMVVMVGDLVGRFTNCRGKHAEEFLIHNRQMLDYIVQHRPKQMKLLIKHHPCHHSRGNAKRHKDGAFMQGRPDPKSCTEQLIHFNNTVLRPNGVRLTIAVAWLYKAFWRGCEREDDKLASMNSLEGLRMQLDSGIDVRGIRLNEWILLANMCTEPVYLKHLFQPSRMVADRETQAFIETQKTRNRADDPPPYDVRYRATQAVITQSAGTALETMLCCDEEDG